MLDSIADSNFLVSMIGAKHLKILFFIFISASAFSACSADMGNSSSSGNMVSLMGLVISAVKLWDRRDWNNVQIKFDINFLCLKLLMPLLLDMGWHSWMPFSYAQPAIFSSQHD
jgi:hypothetical protein